MTKKSMVMIDSNGDSKEPTPIPSSGESGLPDSKGSEFSNNKSAAPILNAPFVDNEKQAKSAIITKHKNEKEESQVGTE